MWFFTCYYVECLGKGTCLHVIDNVEAVECRVILVTSDLTLTFLLFPVQALGGCKKNNLGIFPKNFD